MASVIKQGSIPEELKTPDAFNVQDVRQQADEYFAEIQAKASELVQQAEDEAEAIRETARQQGLKDAEAEVEKKVNEQAHKLSDARCRTAIQACERTVSNLSTSTTDWLEVWRKQTVTLATKMAERIVRREMQDNSEVLAAWLEEAIVATRDMRDLRVLVHPDDFAVAGRFLTQLAKTVPQAATAEVLPDPEVELGGCIVRNSDGQIDQQLTTQLDRLIEQLG
ncbi:MAG: hypothetical protein Aurels2KO_23850 [Aureliella sp.]